MGGYVTGDGGHGPRDRRSRRQTALMSTITSDRIVNVGHDDRDRRRNLSHHAHCLSARRHDDVHLFRRQILREVWQAISFTVRKPRLYEEILAVYPAKIAEAVIERAVASSQLRTFRDPENLHPRQSLRLPAAFTTVRGASALRCRPLSLLGARTHRGPARREFGRDPDRNTRAGSCPLPEAARWEAGRGVPAEQGSRAAGAAPEASRSASVPS
jgi:hypothetical protein